MDKFSTNLAVRALNHWRNYSIPTYLGIRLLLRQVPKSESSNFLTEYLIGKLPMRKTGRYRPFLRFKGFTASGKIENRDMYAASPSTALAEAYALSILSSVNTLRNKSCVYSNRWPTSKTAGRDFIYFYSGYSDRNARISNQLQQNNRLFVVANDIKSFYPNIDKRVITEKFGKHLNIIKDSKQRDFIEKTSHQLMITSHRGIPIGPALSHVLANVVLESVDDEMYSQFGNRYFRYVDDILMVLEEKEIPSAEKKLEESLGKQGFELNHGKKDKVSASNWLNNINDPEEGFLSKQYDELSNRIRLFLWNAPSKREALSNKFKEAGIGIPIQRYAVDANYGRFHHYMKYYLKKSTANARKIIRGNLEHENADTIFADSVFLKDRFLEVAPRIKIEPGDESNLVKKLRIQRLRYLLNRLLYLTPHTEYKKLLEIAPDMVEFYEYRTVINSLIKNSIGELVKIPGPAISTFAEVFQELEHGKVTLVVEKIDTSTMLDSLATLTSFGVFEPPGDWIQKLTPNNQEYINFCMFARLSSRILTDFSYEDELRSLQINSDTSVRQTLMTTRFSDDECINLDALLDSSYGY